VVGGLAVVAVGALVLFGIRSFGTGSVPAPSLSSAPPATPASEPAPAATATPPAPAAPPPEPVVVPPPAPPVRQAPERAVRTAFAPTVVSAALCGSLQTSGSEWQCAPPNGGPGTFVFYTRVASPAPTTVGHRWYRNDRLHQTVTLRVPPNPQHGYRTYSRITISNARAGSWRVELRSPGGDVLHEERFSVVP
jgi:hypothetical protein